MIKINNTKTTQRKPIIDYPCMWEYTVIGENPTLIKDAILSACDNKIPQITYSHTSSSGKYHSFNATLLVQDEQNRLLIFDNLKLNPAIRMVL